MGEWGKWGDLGDLGDWGSVLEDHEKCDLDPDQDNLPKSDLRSRSDPDLTWKYDLHIVI